MPAELNEIIDLAWYRYNAAYGIGTNFGNAMYSAGEYLYVNDYERAGTALMTSRATFHSFREKALSQYSSQLYRIIDALQWISDNWPEEADPYDLTMGDIINAMLTADTNHIMYFVGITDAYRQNVWKKEFNQEFFAAMARGFDL